jgi:hypothetical protein
MDNQPAHDRDSDIEMPSRRRFLKLGLYAAPAVLVASSLALSPKANACGTSEGSGGNCDDSHGGAVSDIAQSDLSGRAKGEAVSDAARAP